MKLPYFKFYPGDWRKDPNLSRCSHAAKGALMDALCFGFETDERGVFITAGTPWSEREIAEAIGGNLDVSLKLVSELLSKGVLKRRASDGAIYSAKMVREEELRVKRAKGGILGGNPTLKVNHTPNLSANLDPNLIVNPPVNMNMSMTSDPHISEKGSGEKPKFVLPANEEEAVQWCASAGVPPDYARKIYTQCEGTGWLDGVGRQIRSFSHYAKHRYTQEQITRVAPTKKPPSAYDIRQVLQAREKEAADIKRKHYSDTQSLSGGKHTPAGWRDEPARVEYLRIKSEIKDLNDQLSKLI